MIELELTPADVRAAVDGGGARLAELVAALTPIIQARIGRSLASRKARMGSSRPVAQEVEDLLQEILLTLFRDDAKVLRGWQPELGMGLAGYVRLVTQRRVASVLRSGKRDPWQEDPTLTDELDGLSEEADPERLTASKETLDTLLERLEEALSPKGWLLFELLYLRELSVDEVAERLRMEKAALYQWRSRLRKLCAQLLAEMSESSLEGGREEYEADGRAPRGSVREA